jgi:hypothetical protein
MWPERAQGNQFESRINEDSIYVIGSRMVPEGGTLRRSSGACSRRKQGRR